MLDNEVRIKSGEIRKIMRLCKVFPDTDPVRYLWFWFLSLGSLYNHAKSCHFVSCTYRFQLTAKTTGDLGILAQDYPTATRGHCCSSLFPCLQLGCSQEWAHRSPRQWSHQLQTSFPFLHSQCSTSAEKIKYSTLFIGGQNVKLSKYCLPNLSLQEETKPCIPKTWIHSLIWLNWVA